MLLAVPKRGPGSTMIRACPASKNELFTTVRVRIQTIALTTAKAKTGSKMCQAREAGRYAFVEKSSRVSSACGSLALTSMAR